VQAKRLRNDEEAVSPVIGVVLMVAVVVIIASVIAIATFAIGDENIHAIEDALDRLGLWAGPLY